MPAPTKRARKVRTAKEFPPAALRMPKQARKRSGVTYSWDQDAIRSARNAQLRGDFGPAARLVRSAMTDDAIFAAALNRLAPIGGLPVVLEPASEAARAKRIASEGDALFGPEGIGIKPATVVVLAMQLVMHGVFFAQNVVTPRDDGSRVDVELRAWPIEHVKWSETDQAFETYTEDGERVFITHGDGRWVVGMRAELDPWTHGAIVALADVWLDRGFGRRDRSNTSRSHGNAKIVGKLPEGVALQDGEGNNTEEANAMLDVAQSLHDELPSAVIPFGSSLDMLVNTSQAWQIFDSIIKGNDLAAARVLLGSDATTKTEGGDYKKSWYLWGIRNDLVEADLATLTEGFRTGTIEPWAAMNFGDSTLAPSRSWALPDADESNRVDDFASRMAYVARDVRDLREAGIEVTQAVLDELCTRYEVPSMTLTTSASSAPVESPAPAPEQQAPTLRRLR